MEKLKFKTNINCGSCVAKITPHLNEEQSIETWVVDTNTADKILTVTGENISKEMVKSIVEKAGFVVKSDVV